MENLDLLGVDELKFEDLNKTNGGWKWIPAVALALVILNTDWDKAADDFCRGYNGE